MMIRTATACFLAFSSLTGCKSAPEEAIEGIWSIDTIVKEGQEYKGCFGSNVWGFESNRSCVLPNTIHCSGLDLKAEDRRGTWKFDVDSRKLRIDSANKFFGRSYRVDFVNDVDRKMLVMKLTSDSISIICRKGLYVYDGEKVSELVKKNQQSP